MEMLSGHLPFAQLEERSNANPEPKAGEDSAPPGEQGEMEAKRSKWWDMGVGDMGTGPDRESAPRQASHSSPFITTEYSSRLHLPMFL